MAGLVFNIRKATNASSSKPYATVKYLNIQKSDLDSTELEDNKIYQATYNLSLGYPELMDENGCFDFEKAYSIFTEEMSGIQEDVKCIDIPLIKVCKHNFLIKRSGGLKITSIPLAYYESEESVIEYAKNYVARQLSKNAWLVPDENFHHFIIDDRERYIKLSKKECIYNNTYRAEVAQGPYVINALHNFQNGVCFRHKDNYYEILIPFIYDSIKGCRMKSLYSDMPWMCYFAETEDEEECLYDIYSQFLDYSDFYDDKELGTLPCLAHEVNRVEINRRLQFILFHCREKQGIIRNGEVFIKPLYASISCYRFILESVDDESYKEEYKLIFVVSNKKKKGLFFENKEVLPPEYDSISVEEDTGISYLIKNNHYYIGGFKGENYDFSMREISEKDFYEVEQDYKDDLNGYEWTEEDTWNALTDGQYGPYPKNGVNWDVLDDCQGR